MNPLFPDMFSSVEKFTREHDKMLRNIFGKYIKGTFLIEMKHTIMNKHFDVFTSAYNFNITGEKLVKGVELPDFDICRLIVGCHCSNTIFLSNEERIALERSAEYKENLIQNVLDHIKLRSYGSFYFRHTPLMQGEPFIAYNVPYKVFSMAIRMNQLTHSTSEPLPLLSYYEYISNKALAALSLLEDNFLNNCYPICRAIIELYIKLVLYKIHPELVKTSDEFNHFELMQTCCTQ